jgi:hypothetical protein
MCLPSPIFFSLNPAGKPYRLFSVGCGPGGLGFQELEGVLLTRVLGGVNLTVFRCFVHSTETLMCNGTHMFIPCMLAFCLYPKKRQTKNPHTHVITNHMVVIIHHLVYTLQTEKRKTPHTCLYQPHGGYHSPCGWGMSRAWAPRLCCPTFAYSLCCCHISNLLALHRDEKVVYLTRDLRICTSPICVLDIWTCAYWPRPWMWVRNGPAGCTGASHEPQILESVC